MQRKEAHSLLALLLQRSLGAAPFSVSCLWLLTCLLLIAALQDCDSPGWWVHLEKGKGCGGQGSGSLSNLGELEVFTVEVRSLESRKR